MGKFLRWTGLGCGGLVLGFIGLVAIGAIATAVSGGTKHTTRAAAVHTTPTPRPTATPTRVRIGVTKAVVGTIWGQPERGSCAGDVCTYGYKTGYAAVTFDRGQHVVGVQFSGVAHYSTPGAWSGLIALLPPGATRLSCRDIQTTGGAAGPAHACLYRWHGQSILVAEWRHTTGFGAQDGWVNVGYDYGSIAA